MFDASNSSKNKMHPYQIIPTQEFMKDDYDRRISFLSINDGMLDNNVIQMEYILFSDEWTNTLYGHLHLMRKWHVQYSDNIFSGTGGDHIIRFFLTDGDLNCNNYSAVLQNKFVLTLSKLVFIQIQQTHKFH